MNTDFMSEEEVRQIVTSYNTAINEMQGQLYHLQQQNQQCEIQIEMQQQKAISLQQQNEIVNEKLQSIQSKNNQLLQDCTQKAIINEIKEEEMNQLLDYYLQQRHCKNCHQIYLLCANQEESCTYHPGRMKFYSCQGCGSDLYFTCCRKCTKCLPGCRSGKHCGQLFSDLNKIFLIQKD